MENVSSKEKQPKAPGLYEVLESCMAIVAKNWLYGTIPNTMGRMTKKKVPETLN